MGWHWACGITFIVVFLQLTEIAWRAETGDAAGTLGNNLAEHMMNAWYVI